jgi:hypothetical protein
MTERSGEVDVAEPTQMRRCPTCRRLQAVEEFYANCAECKDCKRKRSRRNRALQARKLAVFERFVEALSNRTSEAPGERRTTLITDAVI